MVNKKCHCMRNTVRVLKDSDFVPTEVDFDNYTGDRKNLLLINKWCFWERFKLALDDFLLKRRRK